MKTHNWMNPLQNEKGIALISMFLFLVVLTVVGLTSISMTSIENKTARNERVYESRMNINEAGIGVPIKIIDETNIKGAIPAAYLSTSGGPVVATANLQSEILNHVTETDTPGGAGTAGPDIVMIVAGETVNIDIDYVFTRPKAGSAILFAEANSGSGTAAASGGAQSFYNLISETTVQGGTGKITNIYECVVASGCQK